MELRFFYHWEFCNVVIGNLLTWEFCNHCEFCNHLEFINCDFCDLETLLLSFLTWKSCNLGTLKWGVL